MVGFGLIPTGVPTEFVFVQKRFFNKNVRYIVDKYLRKQIHKQINNTYETK